jgi:hypothetical protein
MAEEETQKEMLQHETDFWMRKYSLDSVVRKPKSFSSKIEDIKKLGEQIDQKMVFNYVEHPFQCVHNEELEDYYENEHTAKNHPNIWNQVSLSEKTEDEVLLDQANGKMVY